MDFKLKSGRKLKLKDISVDERDEMMDSIEWDYDEKGSPSKMRMMHFTVKILMLLIQNPNQEDTINLLPIMNII